MSTNMSALPVTEEEFAPLQLAYRLIKVSHGQTFANLSKNQEVTFSNATLKKGHITLQDIL